METVMSALLGRIAPIFSARMKRLKKRSLGIARYCLRFMYHLMVDMLGEGFAEWEACSCLDCQECGTKA